MKRFSQTVSGVAVSLQFDLTAVENSKQRFILYNPRTVSIDEETARASLEIAHWVLDRSGVRVPIRQLEYVNLHDGSSYSTARRRKTTIMRMKQNAQIIQTLWPTI